MYETFADRLNFILKGRKQTPWGKSLSFTTGTIGRMFNSEMPGPETMSVVMIAENANLNWLYTGHGAPYIVHRNSSAMETFECLSAELEHEDYTIYIVPGDTHANFVLEREAVYDYKGKQVPYHKVSIVSGPIGSDSLIILKNRPLMLCKVDTVHAENLSKGMIGSYELFGDERRVGLLATSDYLPADQLEDSVGCIDRNQADTRLMRQTLELVHDAIAEGNLYLDSAAKARIITSVYRFAQANGGVLGSDIVEATIEVLKD